MGGEREQRSVFGVIVENVLVTVSVPIAFLLLEQIRDPSSRLRLTIAELRDELQEAWNRRTVNNLIREVEE